MREKYKAVIKGREYNLAGDDAENLKRAARETEAIIEEIEKVNDGLSAEETNILAALNIAERKSALERQAKANERYIAEEARKMAEFVKSRF